jgi:uncharacterized protein YkwD
MKAHHRFVTLILCLAVGLVVFAPQESWAKRARRHRAPLFSQPRTTSLAVLCADGLQEQDIEIRSRREEVCRITNSLREWRFAPDLQLDPQLSLLAQDLAVSMATNKLDGREVPDTAAIDEQFQSAGLARGFSGENILAGSPEPSEAMMFWMSSDSQRKNILQKRYRKMGVGFFQGYWIQVFSD